MRKVAGYALFSADLANPEIESRFGRAKAIVEKWRDAKGTLKNDSGAQQLVLRDGRVDLPGFFGPIIT